ncbi:42155_t:CDS:2, partial [Gigaspora margarita]
TIPKKEKSTAVFDIGRVLKLFLQEQIRQIKLRHLIDIGGNYYNNLNQELLHIILREIANAFRDATNDATATICSILRETNLSPDKKVKIASKYLQDVATIWYDRIKRTLEHWDDNQELDQAMKSKIASWLSIVKSRNLEEAIVRACKIEAREYYRERNKKRNQQDKLETNLTQLSYQMQTMSVNYNRIHTALATQVEIYKLRPCNDNHCTEHYLHNEHNNNNNSRTFWLTCYNCGEPEYISYKRIFERASTDRGFPIEFIENYSESEGTFDEFKYDDEVLEEAKSPVAYLAKTKELPKQEIEPENETIEDKLKKNLDITHLSFEEQKVAFYMLC